MKLSYNWIKEYVDTGASEEELAQGLTMSGSEVGEMEKNGNDTLMELEITTNRPDCLNIVGLAREAAAVFDKELKTPKADVSEEGKGPAIECVIKSKQLCPRYTARVIAGTRVKAASETIKKHVEAVALRSVNNVVDVTNFCLMEQGQPLHAFDLDKIKGGKIIIREATKGEKIETIDGEMRDLQPGMLVIADKTRPIAVAGIMGGKDTEVTESTKNILLESAYFDPVSVRRTARMLGLSSDSSYRFERGVDKGMIKMASDRATKLIAEETGGKVCELYDIGSLPAEGDTIKFSVEKAGRILGISIETEKAKNIFNRLGITVCEENGPELVVKTPTFREDLTREIDLVEEVARIYGYHNIPAEVTKLIPQVRRKEHEREVLEKLRSILAARGLNEIMTYSLINEAAVKRFSAISKDPVYLNNPVSEEHKIMTPHLLDGMMRSLSWNINRGNKDLGLFEIGKIYSKGAKGKYIEIHTLCIGLTGNLRKNWEEGDRKVHFFDIKGMADTVFKGFKLDPVFEGTKISGLESTTVINLADKETGFIAEVSKKILDAYDIEHPVYVAQIKLDSLIEKTNLANHYHSIPRYPSSSRDVSILCDQSLAAGSVFKAISESGEELIRDIELVDVYTGEQVDPGKKSLTYSIKYGLDTRTLKDEEIESVHSKVKEHLVKKFNVTFR
ncbi:MAG: phenylalanine--tRNA ligase subunit beta [Candidatus Omnitrophota bacterium]